MDPVLMDFVLRLFNNKLMDAMYWLVDNELQQSRNTAWRKTVITKCLPDFFSQYLR